MIGLGVGIDYSLFIVTRQRENLVAGMEVEEAVGRCGRDRGAGGPVRGHHRRHRDLRAPHLGHPVRRGSRLLRRDRRRGDDGRRDHVPAGVARTHRQADHSRPSDASASAEGSHFWTRWATIVAEHPWPFAIVAVLILLTLASPFLSIRYGQSDDGTAPEGSTQRTAFDEIAAAFGPGANGPLAIVVDLPEGPVGAPGAAHGARDGTRSRSGRPAPGQPGRQHRDRHGGTVDRTRRAERPRISWRRFAAT